METRGTEIAARRDTNDLPRGPLARGLEPLTGPVYLRSSDHNLPDAVFALHGIVDIEIVVRIDSVKGRLRATVESAPDAKRVLGPVVRARACAKKKGRAKRARVSGARVAGGDS